VHSSSCIAWRIDKASRAANELAGKSRYVIKWRSGKRCVARSAQREIAIAAIAARSSDLDRPPVDLHVVGLIRHRRRVRAGDGDIDGSIDCDADVDE